MRNFVLTKFIFALLLVLAAASGPRANGQSSAPNEGAYVTDGPVSAIALTADRVFLGGSFNRVGAYCGSGFPLSAATGKPAAVYPKINGMVFCCISDGKGGWYVGGDFDKVGYLPRQNLAHILSTGRVDEDFQADADSYVHALAPSGSTLYVGGDFTTIGGQSRKRLAALDAATGAVNTAWNPDPNDYVLDLALSGSTLYVGGGFSAIGGKARRGAAALNASTGAATAWDVKMAYGHRVHALTVSGSTVYLGGTFTYAAADGQTHALIAAFDAASGAVKSWNPPILPVISESAVFSMSLSGSTLYIGGNFGIPDARGDVKRTHLGAIDTATGQFRDDWPGANEPVTAVLASGTKVFVGGAFSDTSPGLDGAGSTLGAAKRNYLASIDIATGAVSTWNPNPDGPVHALAASGATVFAGGYLNSVNTQNRTGLAALDAATGAVTDWNPALGKNADVHHLAVGGSTLYVQGAFSSIGGQARSGLGAVDLASGAPTAWNPPQITDSTLPYSPYLINAMAIAGGKVYVGGTFTQVGGEARKNLVALDPATGAATGPDLAADGAIYALAADDSTLYAGGEFTTLGGQVRGRIAALDAASGAVTAWNPNASGRVLALAANRSRVFAGGEFGVIGGQSRSYLAALTADTGIATPWNPRGDAPILRLALSGSTVFVSGHFSAINGVSCRGLAALSSDIPATTLPWAPRLPNSAMPDIRQDLYTLAASNTALYAGGLFYDVNGNNRSYIAKFNLALDPARLTLSATSLDFLKGTRYAVDVERGGAPTTRTLTLTNAGVASLVFTGGDAATPGLTITGAHASDFKILSVKPSTLTPLETGESVTVTVQFAPSAARRTLGLDAMLEIKTDSPVTPDLYIPLTGDAVPVKLSGFAAE